MASAKVAQAYRDNDDDESEEDDFSDEEEDSPQNESRTHNCQLNWLAQSESQVRPRPARGWREPGLRDRTTARRAAQTHLQTLSPHSETALTRIRDCSDTHQRLL